MKRFHIHVAVDSLSDSIRFYSTMFATEPSVQKNDYAKWMLDDPRINFAISQRGADIGVNHLGIQVESSDELQQMQARLESLKPDIVMEEGTACCYAKSDKYWVTDPSGLAWESFHSLAAIPVFGEPEKDAVTGMPTETRSGCCIPLAAQSTQSDAPCCVPTAQSNTAQCCSAKEASV